MISAISENDYGSFGFLPIDGLTPAPLLLLDFGIEKRRLEHYEWDNAKRPDYNGYLFQYTLSGLGKLRFQQQTCPLPAGAAFFSELPEDLQYFLPPEAGDSGWEILYVHFAGPAVAPFYQKIRALQAPAFFLAADSAPITLLLQLHAALRQGYQLQKYEGGEWLYRFLTALLREVEAPSSASFPPPVKQAVALMQTQYASLSGIQEIADLLGLSLPHFTRLFHQSAGLSPIRYLTNLRLQHAIQLLLNTDLPIAAIAVQCGFSCANYFSKVFRRQMHLPPAEYRRQHGRGFSSGG